MNNILTLTIPEHLRIGQSLYIFLSWMANRYPKYRFKERTGKLADIFSIPDKELMHYYDVWLKEIENEKV